MHSSVQDIVAQRALRDVRQARLPQEVLGKRRDVLTAIAQGGKMDLEDTEAEKQVFAEFTGGHQRMQRAVGRRDDPDVGEPGPGIADRRHFPVLDGPQQLHLKARRDVADLVQEHGPAAGELQEPVAVLDRPRERPLDVPEQFPLDQAGTECGQADRQERTGAPAAMAVNRAGDQLLAGPALARDQHRHVGRRDQRDALEQLLHGRRATDERLGFAGEQP